MVNNAHHVSNSPAKCPFAGDPLCVNVVQEFNFGENDKRVKNPIKEESDSRNKLENQLVDSHCISLGENLINFLVLH